MQVCFTANRFIHFTVRFRNSIRFKICAVFCEFGEMDVYAHKGFPVFACYGCIELIQLATVNRVMLHIILCQPAINPFFSQVKKAVII